MLLLWKGGNEMEPWKKRAEYEKLFLGVDVLVKVSVPRNKKFGVELDKALEKLRKVGYIEDINIYNVDIMDDD